MYKPINGWTKAKILEQFEKLFTFKSENTNICLYRGEVNCETTRCGVGLFIPDKKYRANMESRNYKAITLLYPDIKKYMPLDDAGMIALQGKHDVTDPSRAKQQLMRWVEENVL